MKYFRRQLARLRQIILAIERNAEERDQLKINQGLILSSLAKNLDSKNLQDFEYKVFSQWGEDGIIQRLLNVVEIKERTFIEFGIEDFLEANCRFLLMKDNWSGFVIDGSEKNIEKLKNSYFYWKYQLDAVCAYITRDNINELLARSGFSADLGILSIDLDGNDYHVLEAIGGFRPRILICEYNAVFGNTRKITVPYDPQFDRGKAHYSHLYWGASLPAITHFANKIGYALVATNSAGINAFYVRNDLITDKLPILSCDEAYSVSKFRDSRDLQHNLSYTAGANRLELIRGLPVFNVETQCNEAL